jgi:hypothetical protein
MEFNNQRIQNFPFTRMVDEPRNFEFMMKVREDQARLHALIKDGFIQYNININIGPNVNFKVSKKCNPTKEEKEFFKRKIKTTKKTELCKNWELYKDCYFKDNCSFAHGEAELRTKNVDKNKKYKTKICKAFVETMHCVFGARCQYSHKPKKSKSSYSQKLEKLATEINSNVIKNEAKEMNKVLTKAMSNSSYKM